MANESKRAASSFDFALFTDGACLSNPGPGGWAFVLRDLRSPAAPVDREHFGGEPSTTNNRMELTAVIEGLSAIEVSRDGAAPRVELCSDSEYVLKGISEWMPKWKSNGWCLSRSRKPVKNAELWRALDDLLRARAVRTVWVRGHAGHPENERCDELASAEAERWMMGVGTPTPRRSPTNRSGGLFS